MRAVTYLHGSHDLLNLFVVELEYAVEDADLVITQGLLALAMEGKEGLELGFLVGVSFVSAKDIIKELGDGPCDGS